MHNNYNDRFFPRRYALLQGHASGENVYAKGNVHIDYVGPRSW